MFTGVRALLFGVGIGLLVAVPVGPMSMLCIRRTLVDGRVRGLAVGSGIAAADALYAAIVAFGAAVLSRPLLAFGAQLEVLGGATLVAIGVAGASARPASSDAALRPAGAARIAGGALLLTLSNPATLVVFVALLAAGALPRHAGFAEASLIATGTFFGSLLWWVALTSVVAFVRKRLSVAAIRALNVAAGAAIVAFGLTAIWAGIVVRHT